MEIKKRIEYTLCLDGEEMSGIIASLIYTLEHKPMYDPDKLVLKRILEFLEEYK